MSPADARRRDEALDWVRRIQDPHFTDWEAHADWLDVDPRNAHAFDEMADLIATAVAGLGPAGSAATAVGPASDDPAGGPAIDPAISARRRWNRTGIGLAVAAGLAALVAVPAVMTHGGGSIAYTVRTGAGERRTVALLDGTRIALNGDSAIELDHRDPRTASLERGEAYFAVVHDAAHPFVVHAGDATFQDLGTAFDIVRESGGARASVHEGAILYDPGGAAVRIGRGDAIEIAQRTAIVRHVDAAAVGAWRSGRLTYADAPMTEVAADLARSIGEPVHVDRNAASARFTGVIMIDPDRTRMFRRVAAITGARIHRDGAGWRMALPAR